MTVVNEAFELMSLLDAANIPGDGVLFQVQNLLLDNLRLNAERERMLKRPNADRVREMIDQDRSELLALMADDALDRGEETAALGWRWLSQERKWPGQEKVGNQWVWGWATEDQKEDEIIIPTSFTLPESLHAMVRKTIFRHKHGYSTPTAYLALEVVVQAFVSGWREPRKGDNLMMEWEREHRRRESARQAALDAARELVPPSLTAAVSLWREANQRQDAPELGELLEWLLSSLARLECELAGVKKANALLMKGMESKCELMHDLKQRARTLEVDLMDARAVRDSFARRIAAQSDLLSKRAEKAPGDYRRKFLIVLRRLILAEPETPLEAACRREEWGRAGGDCVCPICREAYFSHPNDPGEPSLVILCDRSRVKL